MRSLIAFLILAGSAVSQIQIRVDASAVVGPYRSIYAYFGYDEPNYTDRKSVV